MKKKVLAILLAVCMAVAMLPAMTFAVGAEQSTGGSGKDGTLPTGAQPQDGTVPQGHTLAGDGTSSSPYLIGNFRDWNYFATVAAAKATENTCFRLTGNIYMNAKLGDWNERNLPTKTELDAVSFTPVPAFAGVLDGAGYAIYNPYCYAASAAGLFTELSGTVENFHLYGGYLVGTQVAYYSPLAVTLNGGTVRNCYLSTSAYTKGNNDAYGFGGFAARAIGEPSLIENCTFAGTVLIDGTNGTTTGYAGGFVARTEAALTIRGSVNCGYMRTGVHATGGFVGGIMSGDALTLDTCMNTADICNGNGKTGGMAGFVGYSSAGAVSMTACANYGDIISETSAKVLRVAGLVGHANNRSNTFSNCANYGDIKGFLASGLTTDEKAPRIENCYSEGVLDKNLSTKAGAILVSYLTGSAAIVRNCVGVGDSDLFAVNTGITIKDETNNQKYDAGAAALTDGTALGILNTGLSTPMWVAGTTAPELKWIADRNSPATPEITIDGASLTIGENVTLNLFVKTETIRNAGVTVKTISIVNNDGDTIATGELKGTNYVFTISGIKASEFGTNKIYKVQYTTEETAGSPITCTESITYSPLQYAINMYGKTDKAGLDALLLSIVNYADAAAGTTTAKAAFDEKHATADWTAVTSLAEIVKEDTGKYTYNAETMPGIGASLTETIALTVYLKDTAYTGVTMKVGDTELTGTADEATQTVKFEGFWATDLYNEITLTFTGAEGTEPLEATTSLVQYLNRYAGNETYAKVATATAQYLYAARLFCLNNQPNA